MARARRPRKSATAEVPLDAVESTPAPSAGAEASRRAVELARVQPEETPAANIEAVSPVPPEAAPERPEPVLAERASVPAPKEEPRPVSEVQSQRPLPTEESSENLPFARYLTKAREARGLSLDDVAHLTKIRRAILEAVEADARRELPEKVFVLGYVRSYAAAVGLPVEDAVRRFQASWTDELDDETGGEALKSGPSMAWVPPTIAAGIFAGVMWIIVHF